MHVEISLYFIFCIMCSVFYPHGAMTTILLLILLAIHQYTYHIAMMAPPIVGIFNHCTECKKMTVNSYIHCTECDKCFPPSYIHSDFFKRCVNRDMARRYVAIVKIQLGLNVVLSLLQCIVYPPFLFVVITTLISSKSIVGKLHDNI